MVKVKICGITNIATALAAAEYGADAIGFVFADSKRRISYDKAKEIIDALPKEVAKVGVFVEEAMETIQQIGAFCGLDFLQLHSKFAQKDLSWGMLPVIRAFNIECKEDAEKMEAYNSYAYLVDGKKGKYLGGNGSTFDWKLLDTLKSETRERLILAGGLNPENVGEAIAIVHPFWVDVSSGVEKDGVKDIEKIRKFIRNAKNVRSEINGKL